MHDVAAHALRRDPSQCTQASSPRTIDSAVAAVDDGQTYSRAEIAAHHTLDDAWIVVDDDVFDVTTFLDEHPGGATVVLGYLGSDATDAFEVGTRGDAPCIASRALSLHVLPT